MVALLQAIKDEILGKDDSDEEDEDGDDEGGESGSEEEEEQAQQNMAIEVHLLSCLCCTLCLCSQDPLAHDSCLPPAPCTFRNLTQHGADNAKVSGVMGWDALRSI